MAIMTNFAKQLVGWTTPLIPSFNFASLALRMGHVESDTCNSRKQGNCEGKYFCADCPWSEGPFRDPR